jgi:CRISPR-associated Csx2 family protein
MNSPQPITPQPQGRKVFISILGTNNYLETYYTLNGNKCPKPVRFIQEALVDFICNDWSKSDGIIIFHTLDSSVNDIKGSKTKNWLDGGQTNDIEASEYKGLNSILKNKSILPKVEDYDIPEGFSENEIWKLFETIYDKLQPYDHVYFDVTHAFRSIPIFSTVLLNYAKFLRGITVEAIYYGAFEKLGPAPIVKNIPLEKRIAPIIDLTSITQLQDWTFAAANYLENGNVDRLVGLTESSLKPILVNPRTRTEDAINLNKFATALQNVSDQFNTCRGKSIIEAGEVAKLKNLIAGLNPSIISQLSPIFQKISESLDNIVENDAKNCLYAAKWCFSHHSYQAAATILEEAVVTFLCERNGIDIYDEDQRGIINKALNIKFYNIKESDWKIKAKYEDKLKEILTNENLLNVLACDFNNITEVRNDFNHSGMRSKRQPLSPDKIKKNIAKCIDKFMEVLINNNSAIQSTYNAD